MWYHNQGCITAEERVTHAVARKKDVRSIRQYLNGEAAEYID